MATNKHIVVIGDPSDGDFIGPFDSLEQAQAYVDEDPEKNETKFWIVELGFPCWLNEQREAGVIDLSLQRRATL